VLAPTKRSARTVRQTQINPVRAEIRLNERNRRSRVLPCLTMNMKVNFKAPINTSMASASTLQ
jgi:hypothetical protein